MCCSNFIIKNASNGNCSNDSFKSCYYKIFNCQLHIHEHNRSKLRNKCLLSNLPANGLYFLCYEIITDEYKRRWNKPHVDLGAAIFAGGMCGIAYWLGGMPADVLKSRLQSAPEGTYPRGIRSVFVKLMKEEGPLALYKGLTPVMIRAFPANAATFFGIELANTIFRVVAPDF